MPIGGEQGFVIALLDDSPLVEDDDLVCMGDRAKAVGDHDDRASTGQFGEGLPDRGLVFRVDRGGGLVEYEHAGVGEDGPGDGHALGLTTGEPRVLSDDAVVAAGQFADSRVDRRLGGDVLDGPDPWKVDTSGVSYAAWVSVAELSASKVSGARRLHQECRLRVL